MKQTFKDRVGQSLTVGTRVAYSSYHNLGLTLGTITKLGRVNVHVTPEPGAWNTTPESFRSTDVVRV